mmetsp:Transcript_88893/g.276611  ORF Transcript_88893/g.276611 Transcript_88893/m.276611 type:complete len:289 (-) Transcript_88893:80-946(-)
MGPPMEAFASGRPACTETAAPARPHWMHPSPQAPPPAGRQTHRDRCQSWRGKGHTGRARSGASPGAVTWRPRKACPQSKGRLAFQDLRGLGRSLPGVRASDPSCAGTRCIGRATRPLPERSTSASRWAPKLLAGGATQGWPGAAPGHPPRGRPRRRTPSPPATPRTSTPRPAAAIQMSIASSPRRWCAPPTVGSAPSWWRSQASAPRRPTGSPQPGSVGFAPAARRGGRTSPRPSAAARRPWSRGWRSRRLRQRGPGQPLPAPAPAPPGPGAAHRRARLGGSAPGRPC